ncbi:MAG: hypothetical protein MJ077_03090 [Oscillospiraceae bacterium]|nr:hypothetical protein [Oscillospiraceae bacterium]
MEKSLKTLQILAKIGKVFSKIVWICCLVGTVGCIIGIAALAAGVSNTLKIGDVTIHGIIEQEADMSLGTMYTSMVMGMLLCIGEGVLAKFADRYFTHELADGTPFTFRSASEMKRLGILTICIPLGTMMIADIVYNIMNVQMQNVADMHLDDYESIGLGVAFLIMSVVFRYVAELEADRKMAAK